MTQLIYQTTERTGPTESCLFQSICIKRLNTHKCYPDPIFRISPRKCNVVIVDKYSYFKSGVYLEEQAKINQIQLINVSEEFGNY